MRYLINCCSHRAMQRPPTIIIPEGLITEAMSNHGILVNSTSLSVQRFYKVRERASSEKFGILL